MTLNKNRLSWSALEEAWPEFWTASAWRTRFQVRVFYKERMYGNRYGQVVQRLEGLWLHHARRWRGRPLCPLLGHQHERLQDAQGRPEGQLRSHPGAER